MDYVWIYLAMSGSWLFGYLFRGCIHRQEVEEMDERREREQKETTA